MNYREKIREYISCPQLGDNHYGKWGALRVEQRLLIKRLLDELDRADNYIKKVYLENQELKEKYNKLRNFIIDYGDRIGDELIVDKINELEREEN